MPATKAGRRIAFTQARLAKLAAPASGQVTYHDTEKPGLSVRLSAGGTKTFCVFKRVNGRPVRVTVGRFPGMNVKEARKRADDELGPMGRGVNPNEAKRAAREAEGQRKTLAALFTEYRKARAAKLRSGTLDEYARIFGLAESKPGGRGKRRNAAPLSGFKHKAIADITPEMVERAFDRITAESGPAAANLAMRVLRAVLNYGEVEPNPVKRLSRAKRWHHLSRRDTTLDDSDLPKWWEAVGGIADGRAGDVHRDYLVTLVLTGLRKSEAAGLRVADVNLAARTLTVPDTKNRQPHTLPMGRYLAELMKRRIKAAGAAGVPWVFPSDNGGHVADPRKAIERVTEASGVPFTPHDLRRTFATVAEALDTGWLTLKALLNHKVRDQNVTAGYVTIKAERLREPMQAIEDSVLKRAGVKTGARVIQLPKQRRRM